VRPSSETADTSIPSFSRVRWVGYFDDSTNCYLGPYSTALSALVSHPYSPSISPFIRSGRLSLSWRAHFRWLCLLTLPPGRRVRLSLFSAH
jgi:hypothetical protein